MGSVLTPVDVRIELTCEISRGHHRYTCFRESHTQQVTYMFRVREIKGKKEVGLMGMQGPEPLK